MVKRDLKSVEVSDGEWYSDAQNRRKWREVWSHRLTKHQQTQATGGEKTVVCTECERYSGESVTRHTINALQRGGGQCVSNPELWNVIDVGDG